MGICRSFFWLANALFSDFFSVADVASLSFEGVSVDGCAMSGNYRSAVPLSISS
jgi:hypothetical protein